MCNLNGAVCYGLQGPPLLNAPEVRVECPETIVWVECPGPIMVTVEALPLTRDKRRFRRSSSLRPDTLNSTLGIPVVVYLDWGPALVSLFLLWLWLGELRTSGFVISGGQVLPTTFKTQANLGLTLNFHHDDCESVTTHGVNGIRWCLDI